MRSGSGMNNLISWINLVALEMNRLFMNELLLMIDQFFKRIHYVYSWTDQTFMNLSLLLSCIRRSAPCISMHALSLMPSPMLSPMLPPMLPPAHALAHGRRSQAKYGRKVRSQDTVARYGRKRSTRGDQRDSQREAATGRSARRPTWGGQDEFSD